MGACESGCCNGESNHNVDVSGQHDQTNVESSVSIPALALCILNVENCTIFWTNSKSVHDWNIYLCRNHLARLIFLNCP